MEIFDEQSEKLVETLLSMRTPEEMKALLTDLCTVQEIHSMSQRYAVAQMLNQKMTYDQICELTGASHATISRVSRSLMWGAGGYELALEREKEHIENENSEDNK